MGELYVNGSLTAMTLELPWKDNIPGQSSIPEGIYGATLRYDKSRDGFFTIQLKGTGPRTGIQIHVGNRPDEISGCILLGMSAKYLQQEVGASKAAVAKLRSLFYGSDTPIATPDLEISVAISSTPRAIRFFPSENDKTFYWVFDAGYWNGIGGSGAIRYTEVVRDAKWIISKSEDGGAFNGRYVRWGTLGGTPFQVSKNLKDWTTLAPDELLVRDPRPTIMLWSALAAKGVFLKSVVDETTPASIQRAQRLHLLENDTGDDGGNQPGEGDGDGYGDEDGREDGVISYDFDDPSQPGYEGDEAITIDLDDSDTSDDYSDYGDDYGDDVSDGGGE